MTNLKDRSITYTVELNGDEMTIILTALYHYKETPHYIFKKEAATLLAELEGYSGYKKEPAPEGTGS